MARTGDICIWWTYGRVPGRASSPRYPKFSSSQPLLQCVANRLAMTIAPRHVIESHEVSAAVLI